MPNTNFLAFCVLAALLFAAVSGHAAEGLRYLETTGDKQSSYSWSIRSEGDSVTITVEEDEVVFVNRCLKSGPTLDWRQAGNGADAIAELGEGALRIRGMHKGKPVDRTVDLDGLPWLQPLSYSLPRMVAREGDQLLFWTIRPDTLEAVKLKAVNKGVQTLSIGGEEVRAFKVRVTPPGALSIFWHGEYWYREGDKLFLRYEGLSGPPGSPKTRVTLLGQPPARTVDEACVPDHRTGPRLASAAPHVR